MCVKACRGNELDDGVEVSDATSDKPEPAQRIPIEADFIYAYSTTPGLFLCTIIMFIKIVVVVAVVVVVVVIVALPLLLLLLLYEGAECQVMTFG